jgi:uncharacterized protein YecE (DUF72 family)
MQLFVGTSGYSYKEWKGKFYPEKLSQKAMLGFYAERFSTVEANSTFRRMPSPGVLKSWSEQVPAGFRFALKAPQTITHFKRLKNVGGATKDFLRIAAVLKRRLGPALFQLPPNFKKDLPRLEAFLRMVGKRTPVAFEFRHTSWFDGEVFECLRAKSCALCIADVDESPRPELISTAGWGYLRLRRKRYTRKQLAEWIERIRSQSWGEAYVFFKHEDSGTGPKYAARFLELAASDPVM